MKNYVKPVVLTNEEVAESVYMASGDSDCWTMYVNSVQDWAGDSHVFEVHANHSTNYQHISSETVVTVSFSAPLSENGTRAEFPYTISGNTITFTRTLLADAYGSGDNFTCKVWASTGDEATTKAISVTGYTITCAHAVNVQGNFD